MGTPGHGDFGSAYHPADHSRYISDKVMYLQIDGFQAAPFERRWYRWDGWPHGPESVSLGEGSHPFPEDLLEDIGRPADGQPFFLDILHSVALNIQDPDHQFPRDLEQGVPLGVTDPPLTSPGIWPLKKELKGEEPEFQELPHPTGRVTRRITSASSSGAHFWRRSPWAWWRPLQ